MQTLAKSGVVKPKIYLATFVPMVPKPLNITKALSSPQWKATMQSEYDALMKNGTWDLIPPSPNHPIVQCKWVFHIKYHANGALDKYKARLVAKGFQQVPGVDFFDTFSPVVKSTAIRIILSLAVTHNWEIHQVDVNSAFLNG